MVYPWRVSDSDLEELGLHKHCYECMSKDKCRGGGDACPVIQCSLKCGAAFHKCKESEHQLLCEKELIPCLNTEFGCSELIIRNQIAKHLPVCPANIITCTQEWNRWPVFCQDKFKTLPFRRKNPLAKDEDLDLQLAMRDQRMAVDFYSVPRKTKAALRNNLTRRYPAVPLPNTTPRKSNLQDKSVRSLKDVVQYEVSDEQIVGPQYGIAKLFLKNQEIQRRRWKEDVDTAIQRTGQPVPKRYWEYDEFMKGNIHKHCSRCFRSDCDKEIDFNDLQSCSMHPCKFNCGSIFHHCKTFEHNMICPNFEDEGEFDWMLKDRLVKKKKHVAKQVKQFPSLFESPSVNSVPNTSQTKQRVKSKIPPPPPQPPCSLTRTLGLDIRMDTVTKLQQKPKCMHTFLCAQNFRRDQWESHSRNVHSDIHGGLNNWLVARCPMSTYGCGFSVNRFYPGSNPSNKVVYSQFTESFGIQPKSPQVNRMNAQTPVMNGAPRKQVIVNGCDEDRCYLTELPVEILQMIVRMLDSWSLNQLSVVCRYLREIVSTLLDSRGCVSLQWQLTGDGAFKKRKWEVAYKRWFFSNHFDDVNDWGVNTDGAIANHLKECPFNDRCTARTWDKSSVQVQNMMKDVMQKTKMKRQSEWFIQ